MAGELGALPARPGVGAGVWGVLGGRRSPSAPQGCGVFSGCVLTGKPGGTRSLPADF